VQGQYLSHTRQQREAPQLERLTDTLVERVDKLVQAGKEPLLSTTPTSVAIRELFGRIEALENAMREIALEVQRGRRQ
jgi:predicted sugar kinase